MTLATLGLLRNLDRGGGVPGPGPGPQQAGRIQIIGDFRRPEAGDIFFGVLFPKKRVIFGGGVPLLPTCLPPLWAVLDTPPGGPNR